MKLGPSSEGEALRGGGRGRYFPEMEVAALLVGAGRGERLRASLGPGVRWPAGGKAFALLAGRGLLEHAAAALAASEEIDRIQPVLAAEALPGLASAAPGLASLPKVAPAVAGGVERQDSVRAGLAALPAEVELVAVHDAARPLVRPEDVDRVVRAAREHGAALLAVPARDTVKRVADGRVIETPDRAGCWLAQTPQVFRRDWLEQAHRQGAGAATSDDAALVERLGHAVYVVEGRPTNLKVTGAEDLAVAALFLAGGSAEAPLRVGQGFDAHRLVPGRALVLGGVEIPHDRGLAGHSDGDVLTHAVTDAVLGGLGAGDLGRHFPSGDPALEGIASGELLARAIGHATAAGWRVERVDATVIAEAPRLAPHQSKMEAALAARLAIPVASVNVKVTSTDGLGAIGRGEGIAAQALVTLAPARPGAENPV